MSEIKVKRMFDTFLGESLDSYWQGVYKEVQNAKDESSIMNAFLNPLPVEIKIRKFL